MLRDPEAAADHVIHLYQTEGTAEYHGEDVSQLEHALQTAKLAQDAGHDDVEIVAALLHDIGHIWPNDDRQVTEVGVVDHDVVGQRALIEMGFSYAVADIVKGHVDAKRYLVTATEGYAQRLSQTSIESLRLQGGPMSDSEAKAFAEGPWFEEKLRLRTWDDLAKAPGATVPDIESYRDMLVRNLGGARPQAEE